MDDRFLSVDIYRPRRKKLISFCEVHPQSPRFLHSFPSDPSHASSLVSLELTRDSSDRAPHGGLEDRVEQWQGGRLILSLRRLG